MKRLLLLLLLSTLRMAAQNTTVSATMVDTDGIAWATANWKIDFRPAPGTPNESSYRLLNGQPLSAATLHQAGQSSGTGFFSVVVYDSTLITPSGSGWTLTLCANASVPCGVYQFTTAGSSVDLSSRLTSSLPAPRFQANGAGSFGYADIEATVKISIGGCYWNVTSNKQRCWNGTAFIDAAGATGATPAGNPNEVQIQSSPTGSLSAASGVAYDGTGGLTGKQFNAFRYAGPWQTAPGSNNGIATAAALGQTVIAEPSYASTETLTFAPIPSQSAVIDYRQGQQVFYYHDPRGNIGSGGDNTGMLINYYNTTMQPNGAGGNIGRPRAFGVSNVSLSPGVNNGSASVGPTNWTSGSAIGAGLIAATPGIFNMTGGISVHSGIGDTANYYYNANYGGAIAGSDEGNKGMAVQALEITDTFTGTVSVGGANATTVKVTCATDCSLNGGFVNGAGPGDGRFLIDFANQLDTGNIISRTPPNGNTGGTNPGEFVIDHSITPSTAYATLNGDCNTGSWPQPIGTGTNTANCNVNAVSGTAGAFVPGLVCFSGTFHEQGVITGVSGSQLTMKLRHAHASGTWIMQGGPCGQFINLTANNVLSGSLTLHYPLELIGATDGTHLKYNTFYVGQNEDIGLGNASLGSAGTDFSTSYMINLGGTVYLGCGSGCTPALVTGSTIQIYNAVPAVYNGPCTNANFNTAINWVTCLQATSLNAGSATTPGRITLGTSRYGNSAYTTYAGAETLDILDRTMNPPQMVNGGNSAGVGGIVTFTLEPNNASWAANDSVEQSHHYAMKLNNFFGNMTWLNPYSGTASGQTIASINVGLNGAGICCGADTSNANALAILSSALTIYNSAPTNQHKYHGGTKNPIGGIALIGASCPGSGTGPLCAYSFGLGMYRAPDPIGASVLLVGCPVSGCGDPNFYYNIFAVRGGPDNICCAASYGLQYRPATMEFSTKGNWVWNSDFGAQTFRDSLTFLPIVAPTLTTPTTANGGVSNTGGIMDVARTYYYKIYATSTNGNSVLSNEVVVNAASGLSGTNNSVNLTWSRVQGATGYYVCRSDDTNGGSGAELRGPNLSGTSSNYFTDPGNQTFTIACSGITGTAFGTTVWPVGSNSVWFKPPATLVANAIVTLPSQTGTLALTSQLPLKVTVSLAPVAIPANACNEQTFTITGAATGQVVSVSPPSSMVPGEIWIGYARVTAANTVAIEFCTSGAGATPPTGLYIFSLL